MGLDEDLSLDNEDLNEFDEDLSCEDENFMFCIFFWF